MMDQRGVAAERLSHTCQRYNVTLGRVRLDSGMLFRGGSAALSETVAVAVHLDDVYVVCEPIQRSAGQALRPEHLGPLVERQVRCHEDRTTLVALAEDLEEQLRTGA